VIASKKAKTHQEPVSNVRTKESQAGAKIKRHELSEASPVLSITGPSIPEYSNELRAKKPPLRKRQWKTGLIAS
jgi:hypothetical protein